MRADYDSQAGTLQITLVDVDHADFGDDAVSGAIIATRNGGPVAIDLLDARQGTEQPLREVAERYKPRSPYPTAPSSSTYSPAQPPDPTRASRTRPLGAALRRSRVRHRSDTPERGDWLPYAPRLRTAPERRGTTGKTRFPAPPAFTAPWNETSPGIPGLHSKWAILGSNQ